MASGMTRLGKIFGPGGKIPVGMTKGRADYVYRPGGSKKIPNTDVDRLHLANLGPRARAAFNDEIDRVNEGLREHRDALEYETERKLLKRKNRPEATT
jgi:hypothetical protein